MAAFGISEVVDENMAAAARAHAVEFGMDPGSRDMVAFGGAAPLHAARLGEKLGVRRIVIPTGAGVGSAIGFLLAPVAYEVVRSRRQYLSSLQHDVVNELYADMQREALAVVRQGSDSGDLEESRHAYMRYVGQGHEIAVPVPAGSYDERHGEVLRDAFEISYRKLYGQTISGIEIEVLSWTLTISAPSPQDSAAPSAASNVDAPEPVATQSMFDSHIAERVETPVFLRESLPPGTRIDGPALITEDQTTTVVTAPYSARIDARGYIILDHRDAGNE
jgi:N-methylhydantoinase A